jgi:DNA-binding protein HU-beta
MNKQQLIAKVAKETDASLATAERFVNAFSTTVRAEVKKGHDVKIVGFGTFARAKRKARVGRNPQTGQEIKIPAAYYPKFRAGAEFKSAVK